MRLPNYKVMAKKPECSPHPTCEVEWKIELRLAQRGVPRNLGAMRLRYVGGRRYQAAPPDFDAEVHRVDSLENRIAAGSTLSEALAVIG